MNRLVRLALIALVLVLGWGEAVAQTSAAPPDVVVRTSLRPVEGAVLGQRVALYVDVLFRGQMPRPPRVTMPDLPGAQVIRFESQATTLSDTLDGEPYTGQRFEFAIYARRGGTLTVPAPMVTLLDRAGDVTGTTSGQPTTATIVVPPGVDPAQPLIASTSVTLSETWSPAPGTAFKTGDAIVRTIERTAADVPSLAMQGPDFRAPPGVRVYVDAPVGRDTVARGAVVGHRTDKATYVFEAAGRFDLPPVTQPWWDLGASQLRTEAGPGATLAVAAAPSNTAVGPAGTDLLRVALPWVLAVLALGALAVWLLPRARAWRRQRLEAWDASEEKAFHDLVEACRRRPVQDVYAAFAVWRGRLPASAAVETRLLAEPLDAALFARDPTIWTSRTADALRHDLTQARARIFAPKRNRSRPLPPLNPEPGTLAP